MSTLTVPEVAKPPSPMAKHLIPKRPDGTLEDRALCGYLWDRFLMQDASKGKPNCKECLEELARRQGL